MLIDYVSTEDGRRAEVYGETWAMCIVDGKWMRCSPTDPRSSYMLCTKGAGVDKNWSGPVIEKIPVAPKLTAGELEEIKRYNAEHHMPYGQRHLVRHEVS